MAEGRDTMKPKAPKRRSPLEPDPEPHGGKTRPPDAPLDPVLDESFREVQPPGFKDHPHSAIEAADVDVEDTIGGE